MSHDRGFPVPLDSQLLDWENSWSTGGVGFIFWPLWGGKTEESDFLLNHWAGMWPQFAFILFPVLLCIFTHIGMYCCILWFPVSRVRQRDSTVVISSCTFAFMRHVLNMCLTSSQAVMPIERVRSRQTWNLFPLWHGSQGSHPYSQRGGGLHQWVSKRDFHIEFLMYDVLPPLTQVGWASDGFEKHHGNKRCAGNA